MTQRVEIVKRIMDSNDRLAQNNRSVLDQHQVFGINIMASPGAGKTSVILETIKRLPAEIKLGVIEGDTAPVTIDADKIVAAGIPAVQINTGGDCHLDANMIEMALAELPLDQLDLVIVENVGNLICPAAFQLGTHANVLIASVPEGDDKPYKYPNIYRGLDVLIINKIDLTPYIDFRMDYFQQGVEMLNPGLKTFALSAKTGEGFDAWIEWLTQKVNAK
ncbi:MAG: hydrogenase nickel incorporation protein HypB [Anaerolineaceae bacterium]|jgi:hydrogenase nickel incorporation protein HypB|nr:hydrogenase nickel incorporation protein HypB [Anaerolineaceae bacterium]MDI9530202.1 hydrogenase nickel incorporation protein HypB [Chloroflexota bacterium]